MKKSNALMPLIMSVANSLCMGFVMCLVNVGFGPHFLGAFVQSLLIGIAVTLPVSYLLPILLKKFFK